MKRATMGAGMKIRRVLALVLGMLLLAGVMAGCAGGGDRKTITVGISQFAPHSSLDNCREGFIEGLKRAGYVDGENITLDIQNANYDVPVTNTIAQDFVAKGVDLIAAIATPSAQAAFNAAEEKQVPVIFCAVSDPESARLVKSMDAPETHATGTKDLLPVSRQLEMIRAFMPDAKNLGILYSTGEVNSLTHIQEYEALAPQYGFTIVTQGISGTADIPLATDTLLTQVDAVTNLTDNTVMSGLAVILQKADDKNIPVFGSEVEQVEKGCLATVGIDYFALGVKTGEMAAQVLKGEQPGKIPVAVFSESQVAINQQKLAFFGYEVPQEYADTAQLLGE